MTHTATFNERLMAYKQAIDEDIVQYAAFARESARSQFGEYALLEVNTFLDILSRGGKRMRGALVMHGYAMCGGTNQAMIIQAARAIEMLHAYMLILDDIQDRSRIRRGKPSAHISLAAYHNEQALQGDADHFGISLACNAAIAGAHAAQIVLANMDADPQLKLNALSITNRTLMITAHGQTYDIMNEVVTQPSLKDIDRVMEWKTALYSVINPLHVGMVLAGGDCHDTDAITPYALHSGRAFQMADDILGVYGDERELGKNPMDDIREGKQTILTTYSLAHATPKDADFLRRMLGNIHLTAAEFDRCKTIIAESGAMAHARDLAAEEARKAVIALDAVADRWPTQDVQFLRMLTERMINRNN